MGVGGSPFSNGSEDVVSHGGHLIDEQVGQYIEVALKTLVALRTSTMP